MKTLYELRMNLAKKKSIMFSVDQYKPYKDDYPDLIDDLESGLLDVAEIDEFRYISFDKEYLLSFKKSLENKYKKKKFCNVIRNYFNSHRIKFTEDESESGSMYFTFQLDSFDKPVKIRVSDHAPNAQYSSLDIRYDRKNLHNENMLNNLEKSLDSLVRRKSTENARKSLRKGFNDDVR